MPSHTFSVSDVNTYIKTVLESDIILHDVWVSGEISNLKNVSHAGQMYFSLTDGISTLNAVLYSTFSEKMPFKLGDGLKVLARGKIKLFHKKGYYVFQIAHMIPQGAGLQNLAFEQLKAKLTAEGLFDASRKKKIPEYPAKIALITSKDSAAMWDFITITKQLKLPIDMVVIPTVMQGAQSPNAVIKALNQAEALPNTDIIIVLRGGGSAEDLSCFNQEQLVRHIAKIKKPVISAIGHEVDYTLTDFVSDLRLETPSAAARHIAQPFLELRYRLEKLPAALIQTLKGKVQDQRQHVIHNLKVIQSIITHQFQLHQQHADQLMIRLNQANPLFRLKQGYSIARDSEKNRIIKSIREIQAGKIIETELSDGKFQSKVI